MPIQILHAVIHSFDKVVNSNIIASFVKKQVLLNIALPAVVALVDGISNLLGRPGNTLTYGQFGEDNRQGRFPPSFHAFTLDSSKADVFLNLSHTTLDELCACAADQQLSTGGHILVSSYMSNGAPYLLVAMIKQRGGVSLDENYVPIEITELDLSKVYQAARINLNGYGAARADDREEDAEEQTYLCFLGQNKANSASAYFVKALGCVKGISASRATSTVIDAVQKFFKDIEQLRAFKSKARDATVSYLGRMLNAGTLATLEDIVHEVSGLVPGELRGHVEGLHDYLNDDTFKVPAQFTVDQATLKRKIRIKGEDAQWAIQFEQHILGESHDSKIYYNREEKALTISSLDQNFITRIEAELDSRN